MPELTPERFDAMMETPGPDRIIWTLKAIGGRLGRGEKFVRLLSEQEGSPIRRNGRQYYAFETELLAYMKSIGGKFESRGSRSSQ